MSNTKAPEGQIWVCAACGKRSRYKYGFDADGHRCGPDYGWDESCMCHAVLCYDDPEIARGPGVVGKVWRAVESQP